jgi:hypothetical protein
MRPDGTMMLPGVVGTAYASPEINFTVTDSSTAAGDKFIVAAGNTEPSLIYRQCIASAVDGSQTPSAILVDYTDPTGGNVNAGVYLQGEFNGNALVLDPSLNLAAVKFALRPLGLFIKSSIPADPPQ